MTISKKKTSSKPTDETKPTATTEAVPDKGTVEAKKPEETVGQKKSATPGVRAIKTRPYIAGKIVAKYGLDAGVTSAMVEELDKEYGHENPSESMFCLRNAWHSVRGFTG